MKKTPFTIIIIMLLLLGITACESANKEIAEGEIAESPMVQESMLEKSEGEKLRADMRKLWEDHVVWTRNVIFCLVDELKGKDEALSRLLKNQDDIGNAIKAFYGTEAGDQLSTLLREHIVISADVVLSAKKDDQKALDMANEKWYANADEISEFLSGANPNWMYADLQQMMHDHLKLTTDEAVARIKKDYKGDVKKYDEVHAQILMMADMLSDGIIKQFPDKFRIEPMMEPMPAEKAAVK